MKNESWKTIAIIFICLFILETLTIIWLWSLGIEVIENQNECAYNICEVGEVYDAYAYDEYSKICYCYNDGEVEYQKYMVTQKNDKMQTIKTKKITGNLRKYDGCHNDTYPSGNPIFTFKAGNNQGNKRNILKTS